MSRSIDGNASITQSFNAAACGFSIAYFEVAQVIVGDGRFVARINLVSMVGFGLVLLTNLVVTGLIAGRLWHVGRQTAAMGSQSHLIYRRIIHIFLSSGAIYVSVVLVQVVIYAIGMASLSARSLYAIR